MKGYIYKHIAPNGKSYIGQTYNEPKLRWANGEGYKNSLYFYNAIKKYGWDNIKHKILEEIEFDDINILNNLEESYILKENTLWPNGYNLSTKGENHIISKNTRDRLSKSHLGQIPWNKGKSQSEETKQKISDSLKGRKKPPRSKSYSEKMSKIHKGKIISEEHKKRISEANKGKAAWNKGIPCSEEKKQKLRENHRGGPKKGHGVSEETRKKISESLKRRKNSDT